MIARRVLASAGVALAEAGLAVVYQHAYRVQLLDPAAMPDQLAGCGRHFRPSNLPPLAEAEPGYVPVGMFAPPLHVSMPVLGRPDLPACGMELLLGRPDGRLVRYTLQGGP